VTRFRMSEPNSGYNSAYNSWPLDRGIYRRLLGNGGLVARDRDNFNACQKIEPSIDVCCVGEFGWRVSTTRSFFIFVISSRRRYVRFSYAGGIDNSDFCQRL
jgi:hypothetical protein